jgi:1-deoxy-D-xylulose-5-phosphate reductoisomerase
MARRLRAKFAAVADPSKGTALREALAGSGISSGAGSSAVIEAVEREAETIVAAISGVAGLAPTHAALKPGRRIGLANKESLVCAGAAFMRDAAAAGAVILPMDSEHNALAQALASGRPEDVTTMTLTASGGPFRTWDAERIAKATPAQTAKHPTYSMGAKINVDSASLMNKGLELIEAFHLFPLPAEAFEVLVHPQSVVHSLVEYADGSQLAQLGSPDMRIPIAYALAWPERMETPAERLDLARIGALTFEAPDEARFPALGLARQALLKGGAAPAVLSAANEIAVEAFLDGRIGFLDIASIVAETLQCCEPAAPRSLDEVLEVDREARATAEAISRRYSN